MQVRVDPRLQHRQRPHPVELGRMGVEVERGGDQQVESRLHRLPRGGGQVGAGDGAIFRADEDRGAARGAIGQRVALALGRLPHRALGADEAAGPGFQRRKDQPVDLVALLHAGALEILQHHLGEVGALGGGSGLTPALGCLHLVEQAVVHVHRGDAVGRQALNRERTGDADAALVLIGLVIKIFGVRLGSD